LTQRKESVSFPAIQRKGIVSFYFNTRGLP
jgi:hypothetical protein